MAISRIVDNAKADAVRIARERLIDWLRKSEVKTDDRAAPTAAARAYRRGWNDAVAAFIQHLG